ncbi:protein ABHD8-like [Glandiceps talaboti]
MSRNSRGDTSCGCVGGRTHRVAPQPGKYDSYEILEIRPKRRIRVQHIKPRTSQKPASSAENDPARPVEIQNGSSAKSNEIKTNAVNSTQRREDTASNSGSTSNENRIEYQREKTPMSIREIKISEEIKNRVNNNNTVIFFFHGVGGSADVWKAQLRYFSNHGYEVVAPDLLGHGFSSTPRKESAYSFFELYRDQLAVFDKYCTEKNILVGHSYGASFCTRLATERRTSIKKLVLISGGAPLPLKPTTCQVFCLPAAILKCCHPCLDYYFHRQAFHSSDPTQEDKSKSFDVPTYVLRGTIQGQMWPEGDEEYHSLLTPKTLLIYGSKDGLVSKHEEEWMQETIYGSELEEVENAGHMVMIEHPDIVNTLIHKFISKDQGVKQTHRPITARSSTNVRRETKVVL